VDVGSAEAEGEGVADDEDVGLGEVDGEGSEVGAVLALGEDEGCGVGTVASQVAVAESAVTGEGSGFGDAVGPGKLEVTVDESEGFKLTSPSALAEDKARSA
jgi:hypothetical protein